MTNKDKRIILDAIEANTWKMLGCVIHANPADVEVRGIKNCLTCLEIISILKEELPYGDDTE